MVDTELAALIMEPAEALFYELNQACGSVDKPLLYLQALASANENNRELAEVVITKLYGRTAVTGTNVSRLVGSFANLETALMRERPQLADELAVRGRPLRDSWETCGPGLLRQIGRISDNSIVPESTEVVLVSPCTGGHGFAHLQPNRVTFEAVLTNPHEDLPETLRLAWLIAQLNLDLPKFSDAIRPDRLPVVAPLAMIPPVLEAAKVVQLAQYDAQTLHQTMEYWYVDMTTPTNVADRLHSWWTACQGSSTRMARGLSSARSDAASVN